MFKRLGRMVLLAIAVTLATACTVQLVAPYNPQLAQDASSMQAEVSSWELAMRQGAGTIADDPRNPDVMAMLNKWRGEADAMLTLAASTNPHTVNCNKISQVISTAMEGSLPANLRVAPEQATGQNASASTSSSSCEVQLVADLNSGLDDVSAALKWCRVSWVPDAYFVSLNENVANTSQPPAAPSMDDQDRLTKSCFAEFKAPVPGSPPGLGHGRAVSHLLTTLQAIVYVENRKQAAAPQ